VSRKSRLRLASQLAVHGVTEQDFEFGAVQFHASAT
jgi:hypothetical protein